MVGHYSGRARYEERARVYVSREEGVVPRLARFHVRSLMVFFGKVVARGVFRRFLVYFCFRQFRQDCRFVFVARVFVRRMWCRIAPLAVVAEVRDRLAGGVFRVELGRNWYTRAVPRVVRDGRSLKANAN